MMKYCECNIGRVFVLKFDHEEDFKESIEQFINEYAIKAGQVQCIGAIQKSRVVVGPKDATMPPDPMWEQVSEPHEVLGIGTIAWVDGTPSVHVHSWFSREDKAFIGCVREKTDVFIVIEAIITEFTGVSFTRTLDERTGLKLLSFITEE